MLTLWLISNSIHPQKFHVNKGIFLWLLTKLGRHFCVPAKVQQFTVNSFEHQLCYYGIPCETLNFSGILSTLNSACEVELLTLLYHTNLNSCNPDMYTETVLCTPGVFSP